MESLKAPESFKTLMLMPDKSIQEMQIPELHSKILLGTLDLPDSIYFYYPAVKEKRNIVIRAVVYDKRQRRASIPQWEVDVADRLIGSFMQNGVVVSSADESKNALNIVKINRLKIEREENYIVDADFPIKKINSFGFIPENTPVETSAAAALKKIYLTEKAIFLTEDRDEIETGSTKILRIERSTGRRNRRMVLENSKRSFGSFIHQEIFYHIAKDKDDSFEMTAYDSVKLLTTFKVDRVGEYARSEAWFRNGVDKRVLNRTVAQVINGRGQLYIIVHAVDAAHLVLELGMHQEGKKSAGMPFFVATGAISVVSPIMALFLRSGNIIGTAMNDYMSIDKYFYLQGNVNNGFTFTEKSGLVKQVNDDYDLLMPVKVFDKIYIGDNNVSYGIYRPERYSEKLEINRFKKKRNGP
jgi:hypothetical protein